MCLCHDFSALQLRCKPNEMEQVALGIHVCGFNQLWIENMFLKIPESSIKQNMNFPCAKDYWNPC
jgi:hypothetical protein